MSADKAQVYEDSPQTSPGPPSSPVHASGSDEDDTGLSDPSGTEPSPCKTSPPSSPVRGPKRPPYSAYKDDPSKEVPRQTLQRWSKRKREVGESDDDDENSNGDELVQNIKNSHDIIASGPATFGSVHLTFPIDQDDHHVSESDQDTNISSSASDTGEKSELEGSDNDCDSIDQIGIHGSDSDDQISNSGCSDYGNNELDSDDGASSVSAFQDDPFEDEVTLYPGCEKTRDEAIFELLNIYLSSSLSKTALANILRFHNSSLPVSHNMPRSVHYLLEFVKNLSVPLNEVGHYYCRPAMHHADSLKGPCADCGSTDIGVFYELPLETRLKFLFEHRSLADLIDNYNAKRTERNGEICDITDGSEYKRVWQGNFDEYKVTLILNLDGVRPHKSSKAKFWPLMFTVMEISPHLRSSFTIVWGIWFDKELKPNMNLFLKPFVDSLARIEERGGFEWKHPRTSEILKSPVRGPVLVADAPARAGALNMQEHQAKFACNACEQKTNKLPRPPLVLGEKRKQRKRRFVFQEQPAKLRTHQSMVAQGRTALEKGIAAKRGIKGTTVLGDIPYLDLSTCVTAEYMHCVTMGVVEQICSLWFFQKGDWYIGDHLNQINDFISSNIHPPDFVSRLPRPLTYFSYYKANEFRSFLLYFSLIVVARHLKEKYLQHWILFVAAIFLLLKESISEEDLLSAEAMLRLFVRDIGELYGNEQYTYNVHQLTHLVLYTRRWGCLWSHSAFGFENFNGILSRMIHGSKNESRELLNQLHIAQGTQLLKNKITNNTVRMTTIKPHGKPLTRSLVELEYTVLRSFNVDVTELQLYGRVLVGNELFSSQEYDKHFKRRNSYIEIKVNGRKRYGRIVVFCKCRNNESVLCLVSEYKVVHSNFFFHTGARTVMKHIIPVVDSGEIFVCEVNNIEQKLIQVGDFLCVRPNAVESNL